MPLLSQIVAEIYSYDATYFTECFKVIFYSIYAQVAKTLKINIEFKSVSSCLSPNNTFEVLVFHIAVCFVIKFNYNGC